MRTRLSPSGPFQEVVGQKVTPIKTPIVIPGGPGPFVLFASETFPFFGPGFHDFLVQLVTDSGPLGGNVEARIIRIDPVGGIETTIATGSISPGADQFGFTGFPPIVAPPDIPGFGPGVYEVRFYVQNLDPAPLTLKQAVLAQLL